MGFLLAILGYVARIWGWLRGSTDQQLGREKQQNADLRQVIDDQNAYNDAQQKAASDDIDALRADLDKRVRGSTNPG